MLTAHFSMQLNRRFGLYSDDMTEKKILMAVSKHEVTFLYKDKNCVTFRTKALGPEMIVTMSTKNGAFVTCDLPVNIHKHNKSQEAINGRAR